MNVDSAWPDLVGALSRFGPLADRIEGFIEVQVARYRPGQSDWIVLPWGDEFYLFSEDSEAQRRGREIVLAFLGPSMVSVETVPEEQLATSLPASWKAAKLLRASHLRPVEQGQRAAADMLSRLEDMTAAVGGRVRQGLDLKPTHSDLLRDFRLALLRQDDVAARSLLDRVRLNGYVSAENLRYLRIEYLAAFGRWSEMRVLPHIGALILARRPRAISETLLRMVWWTELVGPQHQNLAATFKDRRVLDEFGPLLRSVRVAGTAEGRLVCLLTALADRDLERQTSILECADTAEERAALQALMSEPPTATAEPTPAESPVSVDPVLAAYAAGQFADVIGSFLADPKAQYAEIALEAVLDSGANEPAPRVLALLRDLEDAGELVLSRRARRDLDELQQLVQDSCPGWSAWAVRVASPSRWADASAVARDNASVWTPIGSLDAQQISTVCDALLEASDGRNADQLRASLDLICTEAAAILSGGSVNDFCQVVLVLLSEQDNFSEMVRSAYLELLIAWLQVGPTAKDYAEVLMQTLQIWERIASPVAAPWAIGVLEALIDAPCPDEAERTAVAVQLVDRVRQHYSRLSLRERVEIEELAGELGLPTLPIEAQAPERDLWAALNGKMVGVYSLLPRATAFLQSRLTRLCSVGEVRGNHDLVATSALRSLAARADYLIVDTWHAAHQATAAIDAVRPKDRQIFPRQRGLTGFLRELEDALGD